MALPFATIAYTNYPKNMWQFWSNMQNAYLIGPESRRGQKLLKTATDSYAAGELYRVPLLYILLKFASLAQPYVTKQPFMFLSGRMF